MIVRFNLYNIFWKDLISLNSYIYFYFNSFPFLFSGFFNISLSFSSAIYSSLFYLLSFFYTCHILHFRYSSTSSISFFSLNSHVNIIPLLLYLKVSVYLTFFWILSLFISRGAHLDLELFPLLPPAFLFYCLFKYSLLFHFHLTIFHTCKCFFELWY